MLFYLRTADWKKTIRASGKMPRWARLAHKVWTIRKLMGGGRAKYKKIYSRKAKLNEKNFMHAN